MRRGTMERVASHGSAPIYLKAPVWVLTLAVPITNAADDTHKYFFIVFQRNKT